MTVRLRSVIGEPAEPDLPPGQQLAVGFPVVTAAAAPLVSIQEWTFTLTSETGERRTWGWSAALDLGVESICVDLHAAQGWSVIASCWSGVSLRKFFDGLLTAAGYAQVITFGDYTSSLPVEDLQEMPTWIAVGLENGPIPTDHGGPARLLVPHLYLHQSAKWVRGITLSDHHLPGTSERAGRHRYGDPWREQREGARGARDERSSGSDH